jgi:magnesium chelatase family protein
MADQSRPFPSRIPETALAADRVGCRARPGERSLSHHGVRFLDELPEFGHQALEAMRQPLEDGVVALGRSLGTLCFPAKFMLVGAMNP